MRILVTGATGFIGRTLLMRALRDERVSEVVAPVRSASKLQAQLAREGVDSSSKLRIVEASAPDWDFSSLGAMDRVVHCAGVLFDRSREAYFRINVDGSLRLLATLAGEPKVVILSSQSAGGPTPAGKASRTIGDPARPISWYGESKHRLELAVCEMAPKFPVMLLRAPMVLGPGDQATLPLFRMVRGRIWPKPGLATKQFSWIASDDLVEAMEAWFERGSGATPFVTQATSRGAITDRDLMLTAARVSERRGYLVPVPQSLLRLVALASRFIPAIGENVPSLIPDRAREIWPDRWVLDSRPFENALSWQGRANLEDTLSRTLAWFQREGKI